MELLLNQLFMSLSVDIIQIKELMVYRSKHILFSNLDEIEN